MWRSITNFWTVIYLGFVVANFAMQNRYEFLASSLSALYIGVLSIYVGSKEFDRWYEDYEGRRNGERFVIAITAVMAILFVSGAILGPPYHVAPDIVATYIAVVSIFVITQKSKRLHARREREERAPLREGKID